MTDPERYRVIRDYRSPYPEPIMFLKGEKVTVGEEYTEDPDWKDWVWCSGQGEKSAWVPKQYLDTEACSGVFKSDYNARELSVQVGETLDVYEIVNGFGMAQKQDGLRGWVPMRYLEPVEK
jgi:hypothetical protein